MCAFEGEGYVTIDGAAQRFDLSVVRDTFFDARICLYFGCNIQKSNLGHTLEPSSSDGSAASTTSAGPAHVYNTSEEDIIGNNAKKAGVENMRRFLGFCAGLYDQIHLALLKNSAPGPADGSYTLTQLDAALNSVPLADLVSVCSYASPIDAEQHQTIVESIHTIHGYIKHIIKDFMFDQCDVENTQCADLVIAGKALDITADQLKDASEKLSS